MRIRWRGLELPTRVEPDKSVSSQTYGKFIVEPFERGFGTTVGNSLRRILLSSLEGAAPISVKIAGVEHEFAQIEGVMEDVTDIILNVKTMVISMEGDTPKVLSVVKKGPGVVTAGDLTGDASITVHNRNQVLATLTNENEFNMELEIRKGRGFVTSIENTAEEQIIGVIPIDSVYSPVTRVRYKTEDTRVGQKTNYDRLIMEIWTNGTISPDMALVEAAKILRKHLNAFVQHFEPGDQLDAEMMDHDIIATPQMNEELQNRLNQPISTMDLSVRASNCLESAKIHTIGDLAKMTEGDLLKVRSFGKTSLREVKRKLQDLGLSLGMTIGGTHDSGSVMRVNVMKDGVLTIDGVPSGLKPKKGSRTGSTIFVDGLSTLGQPRATGTARGTLRDDSLIVDGIEGLSPGKFESGSVSEGVVFVDLVGAN